METPRERAKTALKQSFKNAFGISEDVKVKALIRYLQSSTNSAPVEPIASLDDIEERVKVIKKIEDSFDERVLRGIAECPLGVTDAFQTPDNLLSIFLGGRLPVNLDEIFKEMRESRPDINRDGDYSEDEHYEDPNPNLITVRSTNEMNKCLRRDGDRCILTGAIDPEAVHIVPFPTTISMSCVMASRGHYSSLPIGENNDYWMRRFLAEGVGCMDKQWNMLWLGLKRLSITPI
ncbi:hypothetical protein PT974_05840 [Cladobotryum mycophilum]|uniref:HNH nuclease domain-containing protein n=1 Tax=Cladobotryum mycophilum TaxID=491253 RepID=A0ABR0SL60_9HYPO